MLQAFYPQRVRFLRHLVYHMTFGVDKTVKGTPTTLVQTLPQTTWRMFLASSLDWRFERGSWDFSGVSGAGALPNTVLRSNIPRPMHATASDAFWIREILRTLGHGVSMSVSDQWRVVGWTRLACLTATP